MTLSIDPANDYLAFDFLKTVSYFNVTGDATWGGPHTIANCSLFDSLPTFDGSDTYYRRSSLNIPIAEWFDDNIPAQRQDYVLIAESQAVHATTRKYFVDQADFDERLQIWRLQLFTQDK